MVKKFNKFEDRVGSQSRVQEERVSGPPQKGGSSGGTEDRLKDHANFSEPTALTHVIGADSFEVKSQSDEDTNHINVTGTTTVTSP